MMPAPGCGEPQRDNQHGRRRLHRARPLTSPHPPIITNSVAANNRPVGT
jgi:hypothetical protein